MERERKRRNKLLIFPGDGTITRHSFYAKQCAGGFAVGEENDQTHGPGFVKKCPGTRLSFSFQPSRSLFAHLPISSFFLLRCLPPVICFQVARFCVFVWTLPLRVPRRVVYERCMGVVFVDRCSFVHFSIWVGEFPAGFLKRRRIWASCLFFLHCGCLAILCKGAFYHLSIVLNAGCMKRRNSVRSREKKTKTIICPLFIFFSQGRACGPIFDLLHLSGTSSSVDRPATLFFNHSFILFKRDWLGGTAWSKEQEEQEGTERHVEA